ncbi:MAG: hypothetical protein ACXWNC_04085 [Anaerolineales bacterium]
MNSLENHNIVEVHGCIVCGRLFNILVVYSSEDRLVDSKVISPGGHQVPDEDHLLVVCDTHTAREIEAAYKNWQSRNDKESEEEQEHE